MGDMRKLELRNQRKSIEIGSKTNTRNREIHDKNPTEIGRITSSNLLHCLLAHYVIKFVAIFTQK